MIRSVLKQSFSVQLPAFDYKPEVYKGIPF